MRVKRQTGAAIHSSGAVAMILAAALAVPAMAQTSGQSSGPSSSDAGDGQAGAGKKAARSARGGGGTYVQPYIEAAQIVTKELSPGDDLLTYSQLAAGVDAGINGARSAGSLSLRYERRFGWGKKAEDSDTISGVARGYAVVAQGVQIDAGALAARTRIEGTGAAVLGPIGNDDSVTQVYSVFAGPSISTHAGDVAVNAAYHVGYTRVESPDALQVAPGQPKSDVFDDSVSHMASVHAGVKPYDVLPVGLGVGATWRQEDVSNLDQRIRDVAVRADVTVPVGPDLALVGGVGYEDVEVSSRDALRDANGDPVIGRGGRYVTDKGSPRVIAYDTSGFIWDAGVIWRPSNRTMLEAHVGRRYGSTTYYGTFAWAPTARSSLNVSVYDNLTGFGGLMNRALDDLPSQFRAVRNPLSGDFAGCLENLGNGEGQQAGTAGNCLPGVLGSVRSSVFRARGIAASYSLSLGNLQTGIGAGYDRRRFIGARGTVLEDSSGLVDKNTWLAAYLSGRIDQRSSFNTNVYAYWFQSGAGSSGDASALGATAAYNRYLTDRISATAALGIDGVNRDAPLEDSWIASALLGVRYSF
ncbi:MAG: preprotein translocase subunit YajC [Novosphingobium sp.]|nr:preprotein translocase subunit YajC [Novosphingobium sp.]